MFEPKVIVPTPLPALFHFGLNVLPEYSSQHYYFRSGFTDVDEYLSFQLPPELAREFIAEYVRDTQIPKSTNYSQIPEWVLGRITHEGWDSKYWFSSFDQLDEIYYMKYRFCGYSKERNRIYLMNWND